MKADLFHFLEKNFYDRKANLLLITLLAIDCIFIVAHLLLKLAGDLTYRMFLIDTEGGYPEFFQYSKYLLIAFLSFCMVFKGSIDYVAWALFFVVLFLDDAFVIHERVGSYLADRLSFEPAFGLRAVDFGELSYSVIAGMVLFCLIGLSYFNGSRQFKDTCRDIVILLGLLLFFAIAVDMLHSIFSDTSVSGVFGLVEDGGEMIALSLLVWYFYFLVKHFSEERTFLYCFFTSGKKIAP